MVNYFSVSIIDRINFSYWKVGREGYTEFCLGVYCGCVKQDDLLGPRCVCCVACCVVHHIDGNVVVCWFTCFVFEMGE